MKIFGKIAMAAIALSAMLTSCVTFDPEPVLDPGYAAINVVVKTTYDDDVTSSSTVVITSNNLGDNTLSYSDGLATIVGNKNGNKTVNNQSLQFTATYTHKGETYTGTAYLTVEKILPGSSKYASVLIVLGPKEGYYAVLEKTSPVTSSYAYLAKATYEYTPTELGRKVLLLENKTEYKFERNEDVLVRNGFDVVDYDNLTPEAVKACAKPYRGTVKEETKPQHIVVSAWSIYGLERDYQTYVETYGVFNSLKNRIGQFEVKYNSTAVNYLEYAHPTHAAHYK